MLEGSFDVLVIGAGIHGLCVAWELRRRGVAHVAVIDRFASGHARGSSHGTSRITRSSYHHPLYVKLARAAHEEAWPRLASDLGGELIVRSEGPFFGGLFFGPEVDRFRAFVDTTVGAGADVEVIDAREAARAFPWFCFDGVQRVMVDHTAGVVRADRVCAGLRAWLTAHGVALAHDVAARTWRRVGGEFVVETNCGALRARQLVVAAGAWVGELVPELRARLTVLRQAIGYFALDVAEPDTRAPRFPVWARLGAVANDFVYGLPAVGEAGVKIARHVTLGDAVAPRDALLPTPAQLADLDTCARLVFGQRVRQRVAAETCLYTMTRDEHFVVDALPGEPGVVVCSACSGHGFKFGPVIGKLVAEILLDGARPPVEFGLAR